MPMVFTEQGAQNNGSKDNLIHYPKTPAYLYPIPSFKDRSAQNTDSTSVKVFHQRTPVTDNIAFIINGQLIPGFDMASLDIHMIDTFNIYKRDTTVNGHTYSASILISTKKEYTPEYITLNDLKRKHTSVESGPNIFMIDDRIISDNYDRVMVDEKHILKIEVSKIRNPEENLDVNVIRLSTKSKTNTENAKKFMIRGTSSVEPAANYFDNSFGIERQKASMGKGRTL
jgi:hypothetical protein